MDNVAVSQNVAYLHDRTDGRVLIAICTKGGGETDSPGQ
jgi:hypothetical protein